MSVAIRLIYERIFTHEKENNTSTGCPNTDCDYYCNSGHISTDKKIHAKQGCPQPERVLQYIR